MSSPFVRPKPNPLVEALRSVFGAIGDVELSKSNPQWREELRVRRIKAAEAEQALETGRLTHESTRLQQAQNKLKTMDTLSGMAASGMQGFAESVPQQEQMTLGGGEEGGMGFASNLPSPGAVPPDFLPDEMTEAAGLPPLPPSLKGALLQAARGKASESKRSLELVKAQTRAAEKVGDQAFRTGERVAGQDFRKGLTEDQQAFLMELQRLRGEQAGERAAGQAGARAFQQEQRLAQMFEKEGGRLQIIQNNIDVAKKLSVDPSGASDHALGFAFIRALDEVPSVVRSEEMRALGNIGSLRQRVEGAILRAKDGVAMAPDVRADMLRTLAIIDSAVRANQARVAKKYVQKALEYELHPGNVVGHELLATITGGGEVQPTGGPGAPSAPAGGGVPDWVSQIIAKGVSATPQERERVRAWRAGVQ